VKKQLSLFSAAWIKEHLGETKVEEYNYIKIYNSITCMYHCRPRSFKLSGKKMQPL